MFIHSFHFLLITIWFDVKYLFFWIIFVILAWSGLTQFSEDKIVFKAITSVIKTFFLRCLRRLFIHSFHFLPIIIWFDVKKNFSESFPSFLHEVDWLRSVKTRLFLNWLALVITCLRGRFGINSLSAFLKIFWKFSKITRVIYPQNCPNQTCDYWLITSNQQTLCIETNIFQ